MKLVCLIAAAAIAASSYTVANATAHQGVEPKAESPQSAGRTAVVQGEVRKVDMDARKITLKHGPITNLDMPAMSMVFHVKDPAFLDRVKAGDKVTFSADKVDGALTITEIQVAK